MRIAATYANGEIFQHFGHTQQFKVYEVEDGKIVHRKSSAATAPAMAHLPDCFRKAALTYSFVAASAGAQSTRSVKQASRYMQAPQALPTLQLRPCLQELFPSSAKQPVTATTPIRTAAPTTAAPAINNANPPGKCFNQLDAPVKCS